MGTPTISRVYQAEIIKLAGSHPYLMHAVMTVTMIHERYLYLKESAPSPLELYHWQRTCSLFSRSLRCCNVPEDADATFATATLLNGISFASLESFDPRTSWPLVSSDSSLQWLLIRNGIKTIFQSIQQIGSSKFTNLTRESDDQYSTFTDSRPGKQGIPQPLAQLCNIRIDSDTNNNPYHLAVRLLSPLLKIRCIPANIIKHLNFIALMRPEFIDLLQKKDTRALIILGIWYSRVNQCNSSWWLSRRASVEGTAICMYLDQRLASEDFGALERRMLQHLALPFKYTLQSRLSGEEDYQLKDPKYREQQATSWAQPLLHPQPCATM